MKGYSQVDARLRARAEQDLVRGIFQARGDSFKWICSSLSAIKAARRPIRRERRIQGLKVVLEVCWDCGAAKQRSSGSLMNYSSSGLGVLIDDKQAVPAITERGKQARVKFHSIQLPQQPNQNRRSSDEAMTKLWEHYLSQFNGHDFRIVYIDSKKHKLGLQLAGQRESVTSGSTKPLAAMPV